MGNRPASRARGGRAGALLGALLAVATVFVAAPAGAVSQDVHFTLTPIFFGSVVVGTSTTGESVVTNESAVPLHYISASPGTGNAAEFHASRGTCTGALAPEATCDVAVVFAPNQKGLRASTLTVKFGEKNAKGTIIKSASFNTSLRGHGVAPTFTLSGGSAGNVQVHQLGVAQATITNTSIVPLTIHNVFLQGVIHNDFRVTLNTCPKPVLPGGSCSIVATFKPYRTGSASATLNVSMLLAGTKASLVARQSTLTGTGTLAGVTPPFVLSPLNFGTVTVGTSASGSVVLTNTSTHNETYLKDWFRSNSGAYSLTGNNCPSPIVPGSSCDLTITFAPAAAGTHNATLVVQVTHVNTKLVTVTSTSQTSLTGVGVNPDFTLTPGTFPATTIGASSDGQVTVTNTSLVPLSLSGVSFQGADQSSWALAGSACVGPIAPSSACTLNVAFSPHGQGTLSITIDVVLDLTVRGHVTHVERRAPLTGKGVLPTFTISAPSLAATPKGVPVTGTAALTNTSAVSLSYAGFQITGADPSDFTVTGTTCSGLIAPAGTCDLTVRFTPSISSPGTEHASLKVIMDIAGISPTITTTDNRQLTGQES